MTAAATGAGAGAGVVRVRRRRGKLGLALGERWIPLLCDLFPSVSDDEKRRES